MDSQAVPIRRWIVLFSGFLQHRGDAQGIPALWSQIHSQHAGPGTSVIFSPWDADSDDLAEWIFRASTPAPVVILIGYSWGCTTAANLARSLKRRGLGVRSMVLSDPVHRSKYWIGRWRSFFPSIPILIPSNVGEVWKFGQVLNLPRAHRLVALDLKTVMHPTIMVQAEHRWMDESVDFRAKALEICA